MELESLVYTPKFERDRRSGGLFARLLDYFIPVYKLNPTSGYTARFTDGTVLRSPDGCTWTETKP